jgi:hypothetical protein
MSDVRIGIHIPDSMRPVEQAVLLKMQHPQLSYEDAYRRVTPRPPAHVPGHEERATCRRCNTQKPFLEFAPDYRKRNGLHSWCNACRREYMRQYRVRDDELLPLVRAA